MNRRAPRAAALGALLLSPVALSACGAGQVAQTATQVQNIGVNADADGVVLRGLQLPYPTGGQYPVGGDARLIGAIVNESQSDDTLVSVTGPDFTDVEVVDPAAEPVAAGATSSALDVTVPAGEALLLSNGDGPGITLVGLNESLGVSQYTPVTFTFEQAGEVTVDVPVGIPTRDLPRGEEFDWHHEEEGEETGATGSEPTEPGSESSESAHE
ncbi:MULTISPECIES: copper chaperone PCu(A)C [unclassified Modestobacter]